MKDLKQKGFSAFIWVFTGQLSGQLVNFIISVVLARLLSPNDFGLLAMVTVVIGISSVFVDAGLGDSLIQRKDVTDEHYGAVLFFNITVGIVLALGLFFSSNFIANFYNRPIIASLAKAMSLLFIFNSFGNVIRVKLRKEFKNKIITQGRLVASLISGIIGISFAYKGFGVWSLVIQSLCNPLLANLYMFIRESWRPKWIFKTKALLELWGFGFRMFLSTLLNNIFTNADSVIIGKLFSSSSLGYYFRARSFNNLIVQYTSGSLMQVLFPVLSELQRDKERLERVIFKSFHLLCFLAFLLTGFFYVTGEDLFMILFTEKWKNSIPLFKIMLLCAYEFPLSSLLVNVLSSAGNSKDFLKIEIIKKIVYGLNFSLAFFFGLQAFLYGFAVACAFELVINILYASKQINVKSIYFFKAFTPYLVLCSLTVIVVTIFAKFINLNNYFHFIIIAILYIMLFFGFSILSKNNGMKLLLNELQQKIPFLKKVKI